MDYSGSIKKELENSKKLVRSLVTSLRKKTSSSREAIVVFDQFAGVKATFGQYNFTETSSVTDLDRRLCFLYTHAQLAHDIRSFRHEISVSVILITTFSGNK